MSMKPVDESLMTLESSESVIFRSLFEVLKNILVEGNLIFTKEGIQLRSLAVNKTHFTHLFLAANKIDKYYCKNDSIVIGVDFDELHKAVKSLTQDDTIGIQIIDMDNINIYIINDELKWTQERKCSILYIREKMMEPFQQTFDMSVSIPSVLFQRIVRCHGIGKTLQILAHRGNQYSFIYFYTPSDTQSDITRLVCGHSNSIQSTTQRTEMVCKTTEQSSADKRDYYSLKTLQMIAKTVGMSKKIRLFLKPNFPLILRTDVGSMGQLTFVIAMIEKTDDDDVEIVTLDELLKDDPEVQLDAEYDKNQNENEDDDDQSEVLDMATKRKITDKDDDNDERPKKKRKSWRKKRIPKNKPEQSKSKTKEEMLKRLEEQMAKEYEQEDLLALRNEQDDDDALY